MKITNLDKGKAYQLATDAHLEVERTNPFFNDYAEQTVPMDMPATDQNLQLLGHPERFGLNEKMQPQKVSIQDGTYHAQCRQYILSAQRRGNISTSFYINDGSFYSRISGLNLRDIFTQTGDTLTFEGATTEEKIQAAIAYCRTLRTNSDPRLTIFPVLLTDDSDADSVSSYKWLNAFGGYITDEHRRKYNPDYNSQGCDFWGATQRTEIVQGKTITLSPGYYISPFVRARYVLRRVFEHFGYTLQENFFDTTEPFSNMVLLNNVIDPLVNGALRLQDLLPDCTVQDFLSVWRKKFCCEFLTDEAHMTASIVFFGDTMEASPTADLTDRLTAEPVIQYKATKEYQRVVLQSKDTLPSETEDSFDNLKSLITSSDSPVFDSRTGCFRKWNISDPYGGLRPTDDIITTAGIPYNSGDDQEEQKIEIPDRIPELRTPSGLAGMWLYVGDAATRGSKIQTSATDDEEDDEEDDEQASEQTATTPIMLAFTHLTADGRPAGTISPFNMQLADSSLQFNHSRWYVTGVKIFDYALYYNGQYGIFEKFWRERDSLLRNALQEAKMQLLLTQEQKQSLPATAKVTIRGAAFFLNKLKFALGGKDEPQECTLLTTTQTEPASYAKKFVPFLESDFLETLAPYNL